MPNTLEIAQRAAQSWLDGLDTRPVEAQATLSELKRRFQSPLPLNGTAASEVVASLVRDASSGLLGSAGGRFFAQLGTKTLRCMRAALPRPSSRR